MSIVRRSNLLFPSLAHEMFKPDWFGGIDNFRTAFPAVNIRENEKDFVLELAIPGRKKEEFNIEVDNHVLTVSIETRNETEVKDESFSRREFAYGSFKRAFTLPETVNEEHIDAAYTDGILQFTLPKKEEALPKPKRLIEIAG